MYLYVGSVFRDCNYFYDQFYFFVLFCVLCECSLFLVSSFVSFSFSFWLYIYIYTYIYIITGLSFVQKNHIDNENKYNS